MEPALHSEHQEVPLATCDMMEKLRLKQLSSFKKKASVPRNVRHATKKSNVALRQPHGRDVYVRSKQWNPLFSKPRGCADYPMYQWHRELFNSQCLAETDDPHTDEAANGENKVEDEAASDDDVVPASEYEQDHGLETLFDENMMAIFLGDFEGMIPSWEAKIVRKFFSRGSNKVMTMADEIAWAWVDDREYSTGRSRGYRRSLSAKELFEVLKEKVNLIDLAVM